jgi:hypothetical protein
MALEVEEEVDVGVETVVLAGDL